LKFYKEILYALTAKNKGRLKTIFHNGGAFSHFAPQEGIKGIINNKRRR
jgi:hypothetical protein